MFLLSWGIPCLWTMTAFTFYLAWEGPACILNLIGWVTWIDKSRPCAKRKKAVRARGELAASGNVCVLLLWVSKNALWKCTWLHKSLLGVSDCASAKNPPPSAGCAQEKTTAALHSLLKFQPTDKTRRVKPESAFLAAPFSCQREFSSRWCGLEVNALVLSGSRGFYSERSPPLLKAKCEQRLQILPAGAAPRSCGEELG